MHSKINIKKDFNSYNKSLKNCMNNIYKNYFKNKKVLIFGGTGSFGSAFLRRAVNLDFKEIKIFSRDEKNNTI